MIDNPPGSLRDRTLWAVVLEELPVLTQAQLINGLAVGFGMTALLARRILRNERMSLIADALVAAHNALARSLPLFPPELLPADEDLAPLPDIFSLSSDSWEEYLARLAPADAEACQQTVDEVIGGVSRAAWAIRENQAAGHVVAPILEARASLARLHAQLSTESAG